MTAVVCYLENALTPQNRIVREIEPCSIRSLAPDWQIPFIAFVDGQPVLRADWELVIEDGQSLAFLDVNCIPQGGNGGGSDALKIVLMVAVMYFTMGAGSGWLVGAGSLTGATGMAGTMIGMGAYMVGAALVSALIPPPQPTSPQTATALAAASPTYNLQAQGNTARLEGAIPEQFGRMLAYPDFAAQPYQEYAGNEQYIYQLLCIGRGEYDIEAIRIEDTPIANFDEITYEVVQPGGVLSLFPSNVISSIEVSGQTMPTGTYVGPFVASAAGSTANFIGVDFIAPRGLYYANDDGSLASVTATVSVDAQMVDANGAPIGGWISLSASTSYSPWSDWTSSTVGFTQVTLHDLDNNPYTSYVAPANTLLAEYRTTTSGFAVGPQTRTRTVSTGVEAFSGATTTPQRFSCRYPVAPGRYEVRVKRIDTEQTTTRYGHNLAWAGLRTYMQDNRTFGDVTLLGMRARATNNLSMQSSRKINVICTRKIPAWNGSTWSANTATSSPAWAIAYACKQVGLTDAQIDLPMLLALSTAWAARGDTFNARFDSSLSFWEAVTKMAGSGRAKPYMQGGIMRFMRDQIATVPVALFSMRNIVKGSFSVDYLMPTVDTADAVDVGYFDGILWAPARVQSKLPTSTAEKPVKVDIFGVTSRDQAHREGMYLAATNRYRRKSIKFSTEMEGFIPSFGDLIAIQHDMPAWGQGGEITDWNAGTLTATLSEPPLWGTGTHYIGLRMRDGSVAGPYVVTAGAQANQVILASGPSFMPYIGGNEERTHYSFGWAETWRQRARVLSVKPQSLYQVAIEAINEDDNVHTADSGVVTPVAPVSQLAGYTNAPIVTGVTVTPMLYYPDKLLVSWNPAPWADHYLIEQSKDGLVWVSAGSTGTTSYIVSALYGPGTLIRVAAFGLSRGPWSTSTPAAANPTPPPLAPTATATGGMFSVHLAWSFGDTIKGRIGTEIWWSATDDRTAAARLSVEPFPGQEYNHVGLSAGQGGYYWLRVSDAIGGVSPWFPSSATAGLYAAASADPSALLLQLKNSLGLQQLANELATPILQIPNAVTSAQSAAESALQLLVKVDALHIRSSVEQWVTNAISVIDPATGKVTLLATAAISTDVEAHLNQVDLTLGAMDGSIISHTSTINSQGGRIDTAETEISQMAGTIATKASSSYVDGSISAALGAIDPANVATASQTGAEGILQALLDSDANRKAAQASIPRLAVAEQLLTAHADALASEAVFLQVIAAQVGDSAAAVMAEQTARVTAVSAEATARLALAVQVAGNTAGITSEQSARVTGDSANASSVAIVQARLDSGDYAAVKTLASATASAVGGIVAKYSVAVDVNGHVIGYELINNGTVGSFIILADKFLIALPDGSGTPRQVFMIGTVNGTPALGFDGNAIIDGSIVARSINGTGLSIASGTSPAISGTTMTGVGAYIDGATGHFAIGDAATNITHNGTQLTLNGTVVFTDNIGSNAVTVPIVDSVAPAYAGGGAAYTHTMYVSMSNAGKLFASASIVQGYSGGSIPAWQLVLNINGTDVYNTGTVGAAFQQSATASGGLAVPAGVIPITLTWIGSSSTMTLAAASLYAIGAKR